MGPLDTDFWTYSVNLGMQQTGWPDLGHGLFLICESRFARDGMPLNKSHAALGRPGHMRTFFGDLVVLAVKPDPSRPDNVVLADVNFRDLRHTIDYFQTDRTNPCIANLERLPHGQAVPGLMIHCDGSEVRWAPHGLQSRTDKVLVLVDTNNRDEDVPVDLDPCPGARRVGLDWFVRRMPVAQDWAQGAITPATLRNDMARYLVPQGTSHNEHRNSRNQVFVKDQNTFGQPHIGTVVIVEASGGQVEAGHIKALNAFLDSVARFQPRVLQELADEQDLWLCHWEPAPLDDAKGAFQTFWKKWKEEQRAKDADVGHLPSPYEIKPTLPSKAIMVEALVNRIRRGWNIADQIALGGMGPGGRGA